MGDESINYAMKIILAKKRIIEEFEPKKEEIFLQIKNEFFNKHKHEEYMYDLQEKFSTDFKKSIINGHFQWLIDKLKNHNQTTFNSKYTIYENTSLLNVPYCDFYKIFLKYIDSMSLTQFQIDIFKEYIADLIKIYCD